MFIDDPKITAQQAAERFAASAFGKPREVGQSRSCKGGFEFQLVDGVNWYRVLAEGRGWRIDLIKEAAQKGT